MDEEKVCPVCGCHIGDGAYEEKGILYCCEPCAKQGQCECSCCEASEKDSPYG